MGNAIVSFLAAILAGMGVGSGGIMVVWLTLWGAMGQLEAQLMNLIFFSASSVAALSINIYKKRLSLGIILPLVIPGCVFSVGAALIAREIDSGILRQAFGILMILMGGISAFFTLKSAKKRKK